MDATRTAPPDATRTTDPDATVGQAAGEFTPSEEWTEIGRGAMGVVYKATQPGLNRAVAVKMLLGDDAPRHALRFLAEAEAVAAVDHPNVVKVFEFGRRDARPFLVMEFLPGGTLADKFAAGPLPPSDAATLVRKIALGVGAAHAAGVVHRDLKPANVLFDSAGEPKVTDFGLAKRGGGADLTHTQAVMGTPAYMSPEQAKGETKFVGPPTDVWALGVILFEALTGTRPFTADDTWGLLQAVQSAEPGDVRARRREVPRDLAVIVAKCLRKDPAERYATATELAADLGRYAAGESILARPPGSVERALKWAARKPAVAAGWLLGVVAVAAVAVAGVTLKLKADADTARSRAETSEGDAKAAEGVAKEARDAEQQARQQAEQAREKLARAEYARTINLAHREYQRNDLKRADEYLNLCRQDLRGWEWHYVHRLCHPEWEVIPEPLASSQQAFSADGMTFLTLKDGKVNVRHVEQGLLRSIDAGDETRWATLSPDAATIATGDGKTCQLWKSSGEKLRQIKHSQEIASATFSADGKELLALFDMPTPKFDFDPKKPKKGEKPPEAAYTLAAVWSLTANDDAPKVEWRKDPNFKVDNPDAVKIPGVTFSRLNLQGSLITAVKHAVRLADGRLMVSESWSNAELWSADGKAVKSSSLHEVFTPGTTPGTVIGFDQNGLSGVDVTTDKPAWSFSLGSSKAASLDAHPDGDRVVVGCTDGRVEVWSVKDQKRVGEFRGFRLGADVTACRLSADGKWLVAGADRVVRVWRTDHPAESNVVTVPLAAKLMVVELDTTGDNSRTVFGFANMALRSADRLSALAPEWADLTRRGEGVRILRDRTVSRRFGPNAFFNQESTTLHYHSIRWSSEGSLAQTDAREELDSNRFGASVIDHPTENLIATWTPLRDERAVHIESSGEKAVRRTLQIGDPVKAAAFARTGRTLYAVGKAGGVSAWDPDSGEKLWETASGEERWSSSCVDASPDGRRVATPGPNDTLLLLDAATGAPTATLRGHTRKPVAVRFSPDGKRLASFAGHELKVWDPETGQDLLTLECDHCDCLDFTTDGKRLLASGDQKVAILAVELNGELKRFSISVLGVRFSADRYFKLSASYEVDASNLTERVFDSRPVKVAEPAKK